MAGYSGTPLERKLGVRPEETTFLDRPPEGFALDVPTTTRLPSAARATLTFHTAAASLRARLPVLIERTVPDGMIWVCWPKRAAVKAGLIEATLGENEVREIGLAAGLVDVKVCAVDEVWSGLKLVRRLADR